MKKIDDETFDSIIIKIDDIEHVGITCLIWSVGNIFGLRYTCKQCNFHLCETHEKDFDHRHPLLKYCKVEQ